MQEIKCPKCGEVFAVDESDYAQIVQQVRDKEFDKELKQREKNLEEMKEKDLELARIKQKEEYDKALSLKNAELTNRENEIEQLKAQISGSETAKQLAISQAVNEKEKEISKKKEEITGLKEKFSAEDKEKEKIIERLKAQISGSEAEKKLAVTEAVQEKEKELSKKITEIMELKSRLSNKETESQLKEQSLHKEYEDKLKLKDEQIEYYKDFKARQSTKMMGESLEQHCLNQFNSLRMTAFPTAYFEKDNDVRTGSKGDFIFRESIEGIEFISIMFEMKNEMDTTATKHKNEDFFKELDKDRRYWCPCWKLTTNYIITALWTFLTNMKKCM